MAEALLRRELLVARVRPDLIDRLAVEPALLESERHAPPVPLARAMKLELDDVLDENRGRTVRGRVRRRNRRERVGGVGDGAAEDRGGLVAPPPVGVPAASAAALPASAVAFMKRRREGGKVLESISGFLASGAWEASPPVNLERQHRRAL